MVAKTMAALILALGLAGPTQAREIDPSRLADAVATVDRLIRSAGRPFFRNVESLIIYHQGKVLCEYYYNGFAPDGLHQVQSQTKSIVALLAGIAIDKGFIPGEDQPVARYFPAAFGPPGSLKASVTLRDLLAMAAGLAWEEMLPFDDPQNDNSAMYASNDWLAYALARPMAVKPFSEFKYNSGCPMIVAAIIEKASGMKLDDFARKYLFAPLGIGEFRWLKDGTGFCHAGGGLFLKPMDMVKIGILLLGNGRWQGSLVVSAAWIAKATTPCLPATSTQANYGYFWWLRDMPTAGNRTARVISAEGAGGQTLFVFPAYQLLVALSERNFSTPQVGWLFVRESILPLL